ncbi:MAG: hypothetical protein JWP29_505 [Rhodoferax sp.]|nr:hypothetical protein [Rhodoferax sp.]
MHNQPGQQPGQQPDRIDLDHAGDTAAWAKKLDVTEEQIKEAVSTVGDKATDVELHLKGSRSTTNAERVDEVDAAAAGKA